jgi:hypothetical protein
MVRVMGVGVLVALALAVASLALLVVTAQSARADDYDECYWLNMEGISEETQQATRDGLESRGWYDDPIDSIDALYSPGCGAVGEMGGEA